MPVAREGAANVLECIQLGVNLSIDERLCLHEYCHCESGI